MDINDVKDMEFTLTIDEATNLLRVDFVNAANGADIGHLSIDKDKASGFIYALNTITASRINPFAPMDVPDTDIDTVEAPPPETEPITIATDGTMSFTTGT